MKNKITVPVLLMLVLLLGAAASYYMPRLNNTWYVSTDPSITDHGNAGVKNSFAWTLAQAGVNSDVVIISGNYTISTNTVIPATVGVEFRPGARLNIDSGRTVTFSTNSTIKAGNYQIFSGDGNVTFEYPLEVYARWWGCVNNGVGDDTACVQAAIDSLATYGGTVNILPGDWAFNVTVTTSNIELVGSSRQYQEYEYQGEDVWHPYVNTSPVVTLGGDTLATRVKGTKMRNFIIQVDESAGKYGLWIKNAEQSSIHDFEVKGFSKWGIKIGDNETTPEDNTQMNDLRNFRVWCGGNMDGEPTYGIVGSRGSGTGANLTMDNLLTNFFVWGPWGTNLGASIKDPGDGGMTMYRCRTQPQGAENYGLLISSNSVEPYGFTLNDCYIEAAQNHYTSIYNELDTGDSLFWHIIHGSNWYFNGWYEIPSGKRWNGYALEATLPIHTFYNGYAYNMRLSSTLSWLSYNYDGNSTTVRRIYPYLHNLYMENDNGSIVLEAQGATNTVTLNNPTPGSTAGSIYTSYGGVGMAINTLQGGYTMYNQAWGGGYGIVQECQNGTAFYGTTTGTGTAVSGSATGTGVGVGGSSTNHYGVYGTTTHGRAGYFATDGNGTALRVEGPFLTNDPWIDVRMYGATADGTTDDTAAVEAALAACDSNGCELRFGPGLWTFNVTNITKHNVHVKCVGAGIGTGQGNFAAFDVDKPVWQVGDETHPIYGSWFSDCAWHGGRNNSKYGLKFANSYYMGMSNAVFNRFDSAAIEFADESYAPMAVNNEHGTYSNVQILTCNDTAVACDGIRLNIPGGVGGVSQDVWEQHFVNLDIISDGNGSAINNAAGLRITNAKIANSNYSGPAVITHKDGAAIYVANVRIETGPGAVAIKSNYYSNIYGTISGTLNILPQSMLFSGADDSTFDLSETDFIGVGGKTYLPEIGRGAIFTGSTPLQAEKDNTYYYIYLSGTPGSYDFNMLNRVGTLQFLSHSGVNWYNYDTSSRQAYLDDTGLWMGPRNTGMINDNSTAFTTTSGRSLALLRANHDDNTTQLASYLENLNVFVGGGKKLNVYNYPDSDLIMSCDNDTFYADKIERVLSTTTVALNADGNTTIYTVPAGKRAILTKAVLIVGADAASTDFTIGQAGALTDFLNTQQTDNLDAAYDTGIFAPVPNATAVLQKSYAAGTVIKMVVANHAGGATNTLHLWGYTY